VPKIHNLFYVTAGGSLYIVTTRLQIMLPLLASSKSGINLLYIFLSSRQKSSATLIFELANFAFFSTLQICHKVQFAEPFFPQYRYMVSIASYMSAISTYLSFLSSSSPKTTTVFFLLSSSSLTLQPSKYHSLFLSPHSHSLLYLFDVPSHSSYCFS
jgi:hypothetical protein